jgi:hypothetical protein
MAESKQPLAQVQLEQNLSKAGAWMNTATATSTPTGTADGRRGREPWALRVSSAGQGPQDGGEDRLRGEAAL